jgi:hypothetical protein
MLPQTLAVTTLEARGSSIIQLSSKTRSQKTGPNAASTANRHIQFPPGSDWLEHRNTATARCSFNPLETNRLNARSHSCNQELEPGTPNQRPKPRHSKRSRSHSMSRERGSGRGAEHARRRARGGSYSARSPSWRRIPTRPATATPSSSALGSSSAPP